MLEIFGRWREHNF